MAQEDSGSWCREDRPGMLQLLEKGPEPWSKHTSEMMLTAWYHHINITESGTGLSCRNLYHTVKSQNTTTHKGLFIEEHVSSLHDLPN